MFLLLLLHSIKFKTLSSFYLSSDLLLHNSPPRWRFLTPDLNTNKSPTSSRQLVVPLWLPTYPLPKRQATRSSKWAPSSSTNWNRFCSKEPSRLSYMNVFISITIENSDLQLELIWLTNLNSRFFTYFHGFILVLFAAIKLTCSISSAFISTQCHIRWDPYWYRTNLWW